MFKAVACDSRVLHRQTNEAGLPATLPASSLARLAGSSVEGSVAQSAWMLDLRLASCLTSQPMPSPDSTNHEATSKSTGSNHAVANMVDWQESINFQRIPISAWPSFAEIERPTDPQTDQQMKVHSGTFSQLVSQSMSRLTTWRAGKYICLLLLALPSRPPPTPPLDQHRT